MSGHWFSRRETINVRMPGLGIKKTSLISNLRNPLTLSDYPKSKNLLPSWNTKFILMNLDVGGSG